ncbi:hypothetical protein Lal_00030534 [Lupinus albus]|nr:hypothetical protein Lal_00030534 [Lupinus albus]
MKHVLLVALLVIAFWEAYFVEKGECRVFLTVRNSLSDNLNATIHCKSGDGKDLGVHVVPNYFIDREAYQFVFKPNISNTTLYLCGISWKKASIVYVLYSYKRDNKRCDSDCQWDIQNRGLVGYSNEPGFVSINVKWPNHAN